MMLPMMMTDNNHDNNKKSVFLLVQYDNLIIQEYCIVRPQ